MLDARGPDRGRDRQDQPETAAFAGRSVELEAAAQRQRQLLRDREPEPRAASVARMVAGEEGPEDALALVGPDPGPVSPTSTETVPLPDDSRRATRPPSGVHRNAFESKLEMICSTRSPSVRTTGASPMSQWYSIERLRASSP